MQYSQGNRWIWYQSEWFGYFPGSVWNNGFTQVQLAQWFGEVSASSSAPCTDMGNAQFGTASGSAVINNMFFINGSNANVSTYAFTPRYYNVGHIATGSFTYGGPG